MANLFRKRLLLYTLIGFLLIVLGIVYHPILYLALVYCFVITLVNKDITAVMCMLFAWLSVSSIFKVSPASFSIFTVLELVFIIKYFLNKKRVHKSVIAIWLIYFLYMMLGMGNAYADFIKLITVPILLYIFLRNIDGNNISTISAYYILGVLVGSFLGLIYDKIPNMTAYIQYKYANISYSASTGYVTQTRFSGLWADPNYYAIHLILAMAICIVMYSRRKMSAVSFYLLYLTMILLGAMTGSKSFLLMLVIMTVFLMINLAKEGRYRQVILLLIIAIVAVGLLFAGRIAIFSTAFARFDKVLNGTSDLTTGRTEIWRTYISMLWDNPKMLFFGNGLGTGFGWKVPHNTYIDYIVLFGVVGTALFIGTCIGILTSCKKNHICGNIIPIVALIVMYMFLSMIYSIDFVFEISIAISFATIPWAKKIDQETYTLVSRD